MLEIKVTMGINEHILADNLRRLVQATSTRPFFGFPPSLYENNEVRELRWNCNELLFTIPFSFIFSAPGVLGMVMLAGTNPPEGLMTGSIAAAFVGLPFFVWAIWPLFYPKAIGVNIGKREAYVTHGLRWSPVRSVHLLDSIHFEVRGPSAPNSEQRHGVGLYLCDGRKKNDNCSLWIMQAATHDVIEKAYKHMSVGTEINVRDYTLVNVETNNANVIQITTAPCSGNSSSFLPDLDLRHSDHITLIPSTAERRFFAMFFLIGVLSCLVGALMGFAAKSLIVRIGGSLLACSIGLFFSLFGFSGMIGRLGTHKIRFDIDNKTINVYDNGIAKLPSSQIAFNDAVLIQILPHMIRQSDSQKYESYELNLVTRVGEVRRLTLASSPNYERIMAIAKYIAKILGIHVANHVGDVPTVVED